MSPSSTSFRIGPQQTPRVIKDLMIWTGGAFVAQWFLGLGMPGAETELPAVVRYLGLSADRFWSGMLWQPLTTLFLHAELMHLLGNLFFLWMFGSPVADRLGRSSFLKLYLVGGALGGLITAVLAGLVHLLGWDSWLLPWSIPSIGASGAVFTILATYCFTWSDRVISLLFFPLALSARWMLPLEFLTEFGFASGQVNHAAHLSGALVGWLFVRRSLGPGLMGGGVGSWLRRWRRQRSGFRVVPGGSDPSGPVFH